METNAKIDDLEKNLIEISRIKDSISVIADGLNYEADIEASGRALQFLAELLEQRTDSLSEILFKECNKR